MNLLGTLQACSWDQIKHNKEIVSDRLYHNLPCLRTSSSSSSAAKEVLCFWNLRSGVYLSRLEKWTLSSKKWSLSLGSCRGAAISGCDSRHGTIIGYRMSYHSNLVGVIISKGYYNVGCFTAGNYTVSYNSGKWRNIEFFFIKGELIRFVSSW